jgi:hypothetical protein
MTTRRSTHWVCRLAAAMEGCSIAGADADCMQSLKARRGPRSGPRAMDRRSPLSDALHAFTAAKGQPR